MSAATPQGGRTAMDSHAQDLIDFGQNMLHVLKQRDALLPAHEIELRSIVLITLPSMAKPILAGNLSAFDMIGVQLWNGTTNLLREPGDATDTTARVLTLLRSFAFLLICLPQLATISRLAPAVPQTQSLKLGLKAARLALKHGENELAERVFQHCAELVQLAETFKAPIQLAAGSEDIRESLADFRLLVVEYNLLRAALAWQTQRLELAEYFYRQARLDQALLTPEMAEKAADLFHEAAKTLSSNKQSEAAMEWCRRALAVLTKCDEEMCDVSDLRMAISATYIKACLQPASPESLTKAAEILKNLETGHGLGHRVAVALMRLDIVCAAPQVDSSLLRATMARMFRLSNLTDTTFTIFMQAIHKVKRLDTSYALEAIRDLLAARLLPDLDQTRRLQDDTAIDRAEKAVVTYVLFATDAAIVGSANIIVNDLQEMFDLVLSTSKSALSVKAAHAVQTLIWKVAGHSDIPNPLRWCRLLQHGLFDGVGQINKTRIARKLIMIALAHDDCDTAREVFFAMSPSAQNEDLSKYLAFKIALRCNDTDFATQSLQSIITQANTDHVYIYACVLDAQKSAMEHVAVLAMQALIDKKATGVHLPALLRCTVGLLLRQMEADDNKHDVKRQVIQVFHNAADNVHSLQQGDAAQRQHELDWWSKSAFNFALRICGGCEPADLISMLKCCVRFLGVYPVNTSSAQSFDILRRKSLCHFLSATALIVLGRSEEDARSFYNDARTEIAAHMTIARHLHQDAQPAGEILPRSFELLKFDLECILMLEQWDQLDSALQALVAFHGTDNWSSLLDITLILHDRTAELNINPNPATRITELLQKCINETWKKDRDITQMSRWLRLTFSIHISDGTKAGQTFALKIAQQAASIAERHYGRGADQNYPEAELQYLAAVAFNHAIDLLAGGKQGDVDGYIDAALELARWADDDGALHANLTRKREAAEKRRMQGVI